MTKYAVIHQNETNAFSVLQIFEGWDQHAIRQFFVDFKVRPEIGPDYSYVSEDGFIVCEAIEKHIGDERNFPIAMLVEFEIDQVATITVTHGDIANPALNLTDEIEEERQRRIYQIATPDAQAAAYRKSISLLHKGQENWTVEDQAVVARFEAANQAIEAIVDAADALIAMEPQPADFADDAHWPAALE